MTGRDYQKWAKKHNVTARRYNVLLYRKEIAENQKKLAAAREKLNRQLTNEAKKKVETNIQYYTNHVKYLRGLIRALAGK